MIFQFTASYEADLPAIEGFVNGKSFQFTASYEADPQEVLKYDVDNFFQFTASYEADPIRSGAGRHY